MAIINKTPAAAVAALHVPAETTVKQAIDKVAAQALNYMKQGSVKASTQKKVNSVNSGFGKFLSKIMPNANDRVQQAHSYTLAKLNGNNQKDITTLIELGYDLDKSGMGKGDKGCTLKKKLSDLSASARALLNQNGLSRSMIEAKVNANNPNSALSAMVKAGGIN
ncbi:hypothetical protein COB21_04785 [Candidatus Aerophobetes bacterium]|uniref:Uncharacterized protein n=1 Tax=Aerophobetes bacterium TaxID=2030807 RepID=A0A2A4X263_UNCAE|nr:MAG: hypothetical protein COB21_04785 [Candidatus Aerophobetes bacterium]